MLSLTDLPIDILYNIFPYLTAADFLSLTGSNKALTSYRQDPTFWRGLTRRTFRIPHQPLLQADGARWQWLYKHLLTQTQLFTWGSDSRGNLGRTILVWPDSHTRDTAWPGRVSVDDIGVVADVQCGGWATYVLNSTGVIYAFGVFNGAASLGYSQEKRPLLFPPPYLATTAVRYEPCTAIEQFSAGRSHVLGLADNGDIWCWMRDVALMIQPLNIDTSERKVTRVVAGWDRSSLYVNDTGIIYWSPTLGAQNVNPGQADISANRLLVDPVIIPGTGFRRKRNVRALDDLESRIGVVTNHVVLDQYIVFTTDLDKIFSYKTTYPFLDPFQPDPIELTTFYPDSPQTPFQIRDIQGSFRSFAVFTKSGSLLIGSCDLLDVFHLPANTSLLPSPNVISSLQSQSVISLTFGDHHFLALRSNGTIASYGTECQSCGALGLGHHATAKLRGLRDVTGFSRDTKLKPGEGRTVWFEPMMAIWLEHMIAKSRQQEAAERGTMVATGHDMACDAVADYFEREGSRWEEGVTGEEELGAYFVLKVSAAGWHSAALVLVDEEKVELAQKKHLVESPRLPHGAKPSPSAFPRERGGLFAWLMAILVYSIRWFLGLTAQDLGTPPSKPKPRARDLIGNPDFEMLFTWTRDPFPRLRMADGEIMPGAVDVVE